MSKRNNKTLDRREIAAALAPFRVALTDAQLDAFGLYLDLLSAWNRTVSLTSVTDPREIVSRHFGESIFAGSILPFSEGGRLADVGSGAGFPGLPLKIAFTGLEISLVEPNLKKSAFLREVIALLKLEGINVIRKPYSAVDRGGGWDYVCSRALGDYRLLLRWAAAALNPSGHLALWVGQQDAVLIAKAEGWRWGIPEKIPESDRRFIVSATPSAK
jgi:16S rRNA (guanine527-N7)-methyltransferase